MEHDLRDTATWIKSSYSAANGGNCVEVAPGSTLATWVKSSYSGTNGGNCIEVAPRHAVATWAKSSYSGSNGGDCIEVASGLTNVVAVRDSKNPSGPRLHLTPNAFAGLVTYAKNASI
ncbi:DUF397 domain-containing protein [Streptomyces sp. NPDC004838]